jgi:hypothetical protein
MHHSHAGLGNYAATGAVSGAWWGWLLGLCIGVKFRSALELGLVLAGSPVSTALLTGVQGAVAGTVIGGLIGALIGWTRRQKEPPSKGRP